MVNTKKLAKVLMAEAVSLLKQADSLQAAARSLRGEFESGEPKRRHRHLSAAAKRKIARAQKVRWAKYRKAKKAKRVKARG